MSGLLLPPRLKKVDLRHRPLGEAGAHQLARELEHNTTVLELSLYGNSIGHAGASSLAAALAKNTTLQKLWIDGNKMADDGSAALAAALATNTTLQTLWLGEQRSFTPHQGRAGVLSPATALGKLSVREPASSPSSPDSTMEFGLASQLHLARKSGEIALKPHLHYPIRPTQPHPYPLHSTVPRSVVP